MVKSKSMSISLRWCTAAAMTSLLLAGAGCSADDPAPAPSATSAAPSVTVSPAPGPKETPKSTVGAPATTPVPQPSPGDVNSTVPSTPEKSRKPVELDERGQADGDVSVRITSVKAITAKAKGIGEVSGPGLALTVELENDSDKAVNLNEVVLNLTGSDDAPGNPMSEKPAKPFSGRLAAGKTARGVYVFTVNPGARKPITVDVTISGGSTVVVFKGNAP